MNPKDSARLRQFVEDRGGFVQGDRGKPKKKGKPKKPRDKPEPTGLAGTKPGRNVIMRDNEIIKLGGKE